MGRKMILSILCLIFLVSSVEARDWRTDWIGERPFLINLECPKCGYAKAVAVLNPDVELEEKICPVCLKDEITTVLITAGLSDLDFQIAELAVYLTKLDISVSEFAKVVKYINSVWVAQGIAEGNWPIVWKYMREEDVSNDKIQALEDYLKNLKSLSRMNLAGFHEWVMDENAHVIISYDEQIESGDLVIFNVPYMRQDLMGITAFVQRNKEKIGAVVIGWDDEGMNNFFGDNSDFSTYPQIAENYRTVFAFCKIHIPDTPVGFTVTMSSATYKQWMAAFKTKPDFWAVFNIYKMGANFKKVAKLIRRDMIILGMNAGQEQEYGGDEYKAYIEKIKAIPKIKGSVWIK